MSNPNDIRKFIRKILFENSIVKENSDFIDIENFKLEKPRWDINPNTGLGNLSWKELKEKVFEENNREIFQKGINEITLRIEREFKIAIQELKNKQWDKLDKTVERFNKLYNNYMLPMVYHFDRRGGDIQPYYYYTDLIKIFNKNFDKNGLRRHYMHIGFPLDANARTIDGNRLYDSLLRKKEKEEYENSSKENDLEEDINVPINIGDEVLVGKFKNKKTIVKDIGKNEKGDITINKKPLLRFRIKKGS